ncbi:copper chaperone for superoxide dismutase, chloroplastic/cytosolic-like [Salvia divinorum]|uniref:Superoxide dismutase copper chaperone n=1 Tax=Salvia divinorum TaxID=28513 RepID=A0ABD1GYV7_SALDI
MAFLRSVVAARTTAVAAAAVAIPAAFAISSVVSSPSSSQSSTSFTRLSENPSFGSLSQSAVRGAEKSGLLKAVANPSSVSVEMDPEQSTQNGAVLPELMTEFMVDMKCEGCVNSVKNKLETVDGVKKVDVDLTNQVVRVLGNPPVKILTKALDQTGRTARLIGQGLPDEFLVSAAVAEFKGPSIYGVVRLAQVNMELARIEANFSGFPPGRHGWSINQFGDLTKGATSTGKIFNPLKDDKEPLGNLGILEVDEKGEVFYSGVKEKLRVADIIGRSIAVYGSEDKSDEGIAAAVIARSAGVGENYKKLCACDGTTIWEAATNADFVTN